MTVRVRVARVRVQPQSTAHNVYHTLLHIQDKIHDVHESCVDLNLDTPTCMAHAGGRSSVAKLRHFKVFKIRPTCGVHVLPSRVRSARVRLCSWCLGTELPTFHSKDSSVPGRVHGRPSQPTSSSSLLSSGPKLSYAQQGGHATQLNISTKSNCARLTLRASV